MRAVRPFFLILVVLAGMSAYQKYLPQTPESPSLITQKFLDHFLKGEYEEAKQFCTLKTQAILNELQQGSAPLTTKEFRYKIEREEILETDAVVFYKLRGAKEAKSVNLVFEDERWLVSMTKLPGMEYDDLFGLEEK